MASSPPSTSRAAGVEAAISVGRSADLQEARRLIETASELDQPALLGNESVDLASLGASDGD